MPYLPALTLLAVALAAAPVQARYAPPATEEGAEQRSRLTLVDDAASDDGRGWRLSAEDFAPEAAAEDALRLKVKVRPNRAMGRMSLSF